MAMLGAVAATVLAGWAPGAAAQQRDYLDVTGGVHQPGIEVLAQRELFEGTLCGDGMFCPNEPIKRSTVAVWLIRALQVEPTALSTSRFADVDADDWWAPYVERLAELEVTVGCKRDPLRYCPDSSVTRAQMASFLVRAFGVEPGMSADFTDIEGTSHTSNINALAAARITAGCKKIPLRYCPDSSVTRAQMATFMARALGLVPLPPEFVLSLPSHCSGWESERPHDPPEAGCPVWWSHLFDLEPSPEGITAHEMRAHLTAALPNYQPHRLSGTTYSATDRLEDLPAPVRELIASTLARLAAEDPATAGRVVTITAIPTACFGEFVAACAYPSGINFVNVSGTGWWLRGIHTVAHEWAHVRDYGIVPGGSRSPEWCRRLAERASADEATGRLVTHTGLLEAASPAHSAPLRSGAGCAGALIARFAPEIDSHDRPGGIVELSANAQAQAWMRRGFASAEARWWAAEAAAGYPALETPLDAPLEPGPLVPRPSRPERGSCESSLPQPELCTAPDNCHNGMHQHPFRPDWRHYHTGGLELHTHHRWHVLVDGVAVPTDVARPSGGYCEYPDGRRALGGFSPGKVFGEPVSVTRGTYSPDGAWLYTGIGPCVYPATPGHPRYDPTNWQQAVCTGHATQSPEATDRIWVRCGPAMGHRCPDEDDFADGEYDDGWVACGELDPRTGYFSDICRATTGEPRRR